MCCFFFLCITLKMIKGILPFPLFASLHSLSFLSSFFLFFSLECFGNFLLFVFIIFQSVVSPKSSIYLNIISCANYVIVFRKRMLIELLNGYMVFLCIYIYIYIHIFFSCNCILLKHQSLFYQHLFHHLNSWWTFACFYVYVTYGLLNWKANFDETCHVNPFHLNESLMIFLVEERMVISNKPTTTLQFELQGIF